MSGRAECPAAARRQVRGAARPQDVPRQPALPAGPGAGPGSVIKTLLLQPLTSAWRRRPAGLYYYPEFLVTRLPRIGSPVRPAREMRWRPAWSGNHAPD